MKFTEYSKLPEALLELPRSLLLFIGNVEAAQHRVRRLDHQPEFNRCWPGASVSDSAAAGMFLNLMERLKYDVGVEPAEIDPLPDSIPRVSNPGGPEG